MSRANSIHGFFDISSEVILTQKQWFESKYFPIYYSDKDKREAENFTKELGEVLRFKDGQSGIDICCGTGRYTIELNKLGLKMLGVDLSKYQIQQAKALVNPTLDFQVNDIKKFRPNEKFDYAFNFFSSFGYVNEASNLEILNNINRMLKPNGMLILDYWNPSHEKYRERLNRGEERIREKKIGEVIFTTRSVISKEHYSKKILVRHHGIRQAFGECIMVIDVDTFQRYFKESNFEVLKIYGDYDLAPYNKFLSDRIIFFVNRK